MAEASAFLGIFEGAARLLTGRAVRKNFLKDQSFGDAGMGILRGENLRDMSVYPLVN